MWEDGQAYVGFRRSKLVCHLAVVIVLLVLDVALLRCVGLKPRNPQPCCNLSILFGGRQPGGEGPFATQMQYMRGQKCFRRCFDNQTLILPLSLSATPLLSPSLHANCNGLRRLVQQILRAAHAYAICVPEGGRRVRNRRHVLPRQDLVP